MDSWDKINPYIKILFSRIVDQPEVARIGDKIIQVRALVNFPPKEYLPAVTAYTVRFSVWCEGRRLKINRVQLLEDEGRLVARFFLQEPIPDQILKISVLDPSCGLTKPYPSIEVDFRLAAQYNEEGVVVH